MATLKTLGSQNEKAISMLVEFKGLILCVCGGGDRCFKSVGSAILLSLLLRESNVSDLETIFSGSVTSVLERWHSGTVSPMAARSLK